jgi:hypothetical protein
MPQTLVDWPPDQLLEGTVRIKHRLLDTGLFEDAKLIELFDRHQPEELLVYRMGGDHRNLDDFQLGERGTLTATQLLDAVYQGSLWLNILNMPRNHPVFAQLVDGLYDELEAKLPGFETVYRSANLLISSPTAKVYYHADAPLNMLWHVRGRKRVWVYPGDERFAPQEWVEMLFSRESEDDLPYRPELDRHATPYDLDPGEMLTWPQNTPHRVDNLEGLNVSLTTEHYTPHALKKRLTYLANRYFREWLGLPMRNVRVTGARAALKRAAFRIVRRLPGLRPFTPYLNEAKFSLDGR